MLLLKKCIKESVFEQGLGKKTGCYCCCCWGGESLTRKDSGTAPSSSCGPRAVFLLVLLVRSPKFFFVYLAHPNFWFCVPGVYKKNQVCTKCVSTCVMELRAKIPFVCHRLSSSLPMSLSVPVPDTMKQSQLKLLTKPPLSEQASSSSTGRSSATTSAKKRRKVSGGQPEDMRKTDHKKTFQLSWMTGRPWLQYDEELGMWCLICHSHHNAAAVVGPYSHKHALVNPTKLYHYKNFA